MSSSHLQLQLAYILTLFLLQISKSTAAAVSSCESRCGNISIQYPFGIGSNCAMNEWFEVICNKTARSTRTYLRSIDFQLMKINYAGSKIRVRSPIISSNCSDHKTGQPFYLKGTPFTVSASNKFTVVGCKNRALLTSAEPNIIGCQPTCDENQKPEGRDPPCSGNICCQTPIPYYLQVFKPEFENKDTKCKLAFIAEDSWFVSHVRHPDMILRWKFVPMLIDWKINASAPESIGINKETTSSVIRYYNGFRFPYPNNSYLICKQGYSGNPYIFDGCKDVDECMRPKVRSRCRGTCTNTRGSYRCEARKSWIIILATSVGSGALSLLIAAWWLSKFIKKRKIIQQKKKFFKQNGGLLLHQQICSNQANVDKIKIFSSKELERATDRFDVNRILGQGGQGTVFKGMLVDGRIVAVKKSMKVNEAKLKEFINEVVILSQINHRNIVKLLGCCLETEVPMLVYEFIPNGTLYHYLHYYQNEEFQLSWERRLQIAVEVSGALCYLHSAASSPIYHRDIKSTNILLDENYRAKVSDFGVSRFISIDQTHLTTHVHGTFGYVDPEYFLSHKFTDKSDVYSFGVVLVELLTGQEAVSSSKSGGCTGLAANFMVYMEQDKLFDIIDPRIMEHCHKGEVKVVANLAKRCLNLYGKKRPTMKQVTMELEGLRLSNKSSIILRNNEKIKSSILDAKFISMHFANSENIGDDSSVDIEPLLESGKTW